MLRRLLLAAALLMTSSAANAAAPPDLILFNGKIFSGDAAHAGATALAIRGERIQAIGSDATIRRLAKKSTRQIDLAGRRVVPGINDAHLHEPGSSAWKDVSVGDGGSAETFLGAVKEAVAKNGATPLRFGIPLPLTDDAAINLAALDAISGDTPLRLGVVGGHAALFNSAALRRAGFEAATLDESGGRLGRSDGKLNGWVYEHMLWKADVRLAARQSDDEIRAELDGFAAEAARFGITSVQSMPDSNLEQIRRAAAKSTVPLRWRWMPFQLAVVDPAPRGTVKYVLDGTPIERGAALNAPYSDDAKTAGGLNYTPEQIRSIIQTAARGDAQLLMHIVGDRTLDVVFDNVAKTRAEWPKKRVRIEHGEFIATHLDDAKKYGVIVVQNPAHFMLPAIVNKRLGDRVASLQLLETLLDRGIPLALGSDGPLNPWLNIMFATMHPQNPKEAISVEQALVAYTRGSAYAEFQENEKGTLTPGKLADLAVLSQDVFAVPPQQLPATHSVFTLVGGRVSHDELSK